MLSFPETGFPVADGEIAPARDVLVLWNLNDVLDGVTAAFECP